MNLSTLGVKAKVEGGKK